ncbi:bombesin receptor subtype-3 isoform X2 [Exaiptasia diaphana]|uniref:G-protein coupled receptors family 1 profile domain-containing protein n=1 Tax=Exaiptasia diaphana TaxID=2652724 RepID=A0A913X1L8_EXADI|nr:bombesin receptor subtype-3 isoform X2 [Exaiptasia diaphana]
MDLQMMLNNTTSVFPTVTSYRQASEQHVALRTGLGIISFLSFTGNGSLVLMFFKNRDMLRTPYSMFILSLAVTDMTTGIGLILTPAYIIGTYNFPIPSGFAGELFCRIVASYFLVFYLGIVSVFTIACLALERWYAVARPAKYKASFKKTRVLGILSSVWLCSFALNLPQMFEMTLGPNGNCVWITLTEGRLRRAVAIIEFNGKFFIPLVVTSAAFINLGLRVRQSPALFKTNHGRAGIRLLRMCTVTAVVLAICWFPNQFYYLLFKFDITLMDNPAHHFTVIMCMGNSCVNPFIYCATNKSYRKKFIKLLCPCWKRYVGPVDGTSESPRQLHNSISGEGLDGDLFEGDIMMDPAELEQLKREWNNKN